MFKILSVADVNRAVQCLQAHKGTAAQSCHPRGSTVDVDAIQWNQQELMQRLQPYTYDETVQRRRMASFLASQCSTPLLLLTATQLLAAAAVLTELGTQLLAAAAVLTELGKLYCCACIRRQQMSYSNSCWCTHSDTYAAHRTL
jgi:hypothetical protein